MPEGRIAVVTGAGSGIGRALGLALLGAGAARVVLADVDGEAAGRVAEESGARAVAMTLDVRNEAAVVAAVARVEAEVGPIALWCSNAGVHRGHGLGDAADWDLSLGVNLRGHVHAARAVIPRMAGRGAGCFVVTASAAGLLADLRSAPYSVTKHAAVALAEWLSIRHAEEGIGVSCICPEGVRTGMTRGDSARAAGGMDFMEAEEVARIVLDGLREGRFLILPHPRVAEFEARRAGNRERWLAGMRRARGRMAQGS